MECLVQHRDDLVKKVKPLEISTSNLKYSYSAFYVRILVYVAMCEGAKESKSVSTVLEPAVVFLHTADPEAERSKQSYE